MDWHVTHTIKSYFFVCFVCVYVTWIWFIISRFFASRNYFISNHWLDYVNHYRNVADLMIPNWKWFELFGEVPNFQSHFFFDFQRNQKNWMGMKFLLGIPMRESFSLFNLANLQWLFWRKKKAFCFWLYRIENPLNSHEFILFFPLL